MRINNNKCNIYKKKKEKKLWKGKKKQKCHKNKPCRKCRYITHARIMKKERKKVQENLRKKGKNDSM